MRRVGTLRKSTILLDPRVLDAVVTMLEQITTAIWLVRDFWWLLPEAGTVTTLDGHEVIRPA